MNRIIEWFLGLEAGKLAGADWSFSFIAEPNVYLRFAMVVAIAAMAYLTIRSYRREGDASGRVKGLLAAIRIVIILLAFVVLLRPAVVLHYSKTLYSTVGLLLDDSLSMSFTDRYADEKVAGARGKTAEFLDVEPARLETMRRMDILRAALDRSGGAIELLQKDHPIDVLKFSGADSGTACRLLDTLPVLEEQDESANGDATTEPVTLSGMLDTLRASGHETNIPAALRDGMRRLHGRRVAALILVSDGQMTSPGAPSRLNSALQYARQQGIPLYTILIGDPTPPKNLAVVALQAPREARSRSDVEFAVTLAHRNLVGQEITVRIERRRAAEDKWTDTNVSKTVTLNGKSKSAGAELSRGLQSVSLRCVMPEELGEFVYRASVKARSDEQTADDNSAEAAVKVSDRKIRILLVSGDAGREFQFLRNYLHRQEHLYRLSVWQQNADVDVNQMSSTGMKLSRLPRDLGELIGVAGDKDRPGYDMVILYDPQHTDKGFDETFVKLLYKFVTEHNGGLCYIASNKYTEGILRGTDFTPLADLLPVQIGANTADLLDRIRRERPESWPVALAPYGLDHPMMRLGITAEDNTSVWNSLPGIYWSHPVYKIKPAARVLAVNSNPARQTAKQDREPLVVAQSVGAGRVLYIGFDESWRWRFLRDSRYYRIFWSNVVRYLASLKARQIVITTGGERFNVGQEITIRAEAYDDEFRPLTTKTLDIVKINIGTQEKETLHLTKDESGKGRYKLTVKMAHAGTFNLTALEDDPLAGEKVASKRIVVSLPQAEWKRCEADTATMQTIASNPKNVLNVWEIDRLAELIRPDRFPAVNNVERELWDSWLTLLVIVVLLTIEWILRKKHNMA